MRIEDVDLFAVATKLKDHIPPGEPPVGYLRGRSYFRDVIVHEMKCSDLEAEEMVDTLETNGYLKFEGDPRERSEVRADVLPVTAHTRAETRRSVRDDLRPFVRVGVFSGSLRARDSREGSESGKSEGTRAHAELAQQDLYHI